ncbi:MAG: hypothetical protein GX569_09145, partial [Candidatus Riflebacteria bacterium]|nr:hypothetical protein [Candidatus Riflebacteria bacterium]
PQMALAQPWLKKIAQFTSDTTADELRKIFGEASSEDFDSDEIVLTFARSGLNLEFELTPEARLKRWNIFPEMDR